MTDSLRIERNVAVASGAVFLVGLGEELWKKFLPKYLESLGASVAAVGLFGTAEDFFDSIYQYPGGCLSDRWGREAGSPIFGNWLEKNFCPATTADRCDARL